MTEALGEIGNDFSMNIAKSWEQAFNNTSTTNTRKVILRTSIVFGKNGGVLNPLKNLTKYGLGGTQGSGNQKVSWIHEIDFARAIDFILTNEKLYGVFNLSVPEPSDNKTLMKTLRRILKRPFGISHPKWLLEIGAKLLGTETELVLKSRNVIPERLIKQGFKHKHVEIDKALAELLH